MILYILKPVRVFIIAASVTLTKYLGVQILNIYPQHL